jgi:two-component system, OmpR family, phosphate regulon sensor histidine kinase PhoR
VTSGPWGYVAARIAALLGAAVLLGWMFGYPLAWLSAALVGYLGWHL